MRGIERLWIVLIGLGLLAGCSGPVATETAFRAEAEVANSYADVLVEQAPLAGSLFASDTSLLSNEAVTSVLSTPVRLPDEAKVALLNLTPGGVGLRVYGSYWRTEEYMDLQHRYVEALKDPLSEAERIREVVAVPSVMIDRDMTLPQMREAAARLQADLLVIYGVRSDIFEKTRFWEKDQVKAYATCELLLFDTRTGVIPFTTMRTEKVVTEKQPEDFNWSETVQRAKSEATLRVLKEVGVEVAQFLKES